MSSTLPVSHIGSSQHTSAAGTRRSPIAAATLRVQLSGLVTLLFALFQGLFAVEVLADIRVIPVAVVLVVSALVNAVAGTIWNRTNLVTYLVIAFNAIIAIVVLVLLLPEYDIDAWPIINGVLTLVKIGFSIRKIFALEELQRLEAEVDAQVKMSARDPGRAGYASSPAPEQPSAPV